jgi:hypothetical protein
MRINIYQQVSNNTENPDNNFVMYLFFGCCIVIYNT